MSFSTDFSELSDGDRLETSADWTLDAPVPGRRYLVKDTVLGATGVRFAQDNGDPLNVGARYLLPDQGGADHYLNIRNAELDAGEAWVAAVRVGASGSDPEHVGLEHVGTGSSGYRFRDTHGEVSVTFQGVADAWYRMEAEGTTYRIFSGGNGATPGTWSQIGSDQTGATTSTTSTSMGFVNQLFGSGTKLYARNIEAGVLGGGGTTVSAVTESLQVSTGQASISLDQAIEAALRNLSLSTGHGVVSLDRTLGANVEAIHLRTNQAGVAADSSFSASVQSILVGTFAASTSTGTQLSATLQGIALTTNQVQVIRDTALSAVAQEATLTTQPANVVLGASIGAASQDIALSTFMAQVIRDIALSADSQGMEIHTDPANVTLGSAIAGDSQGINLTTFQSGIELEVTIQGSMQNISVETLAASVGLGSNIAAFTEAMQLTPQGFAVEFGSSVEASTEQVHLSTFGATVSGDLAAILAQGLEYTLPINRMHFKFTGEDG